MVVKIDNNAGSSIVPKTVDIFQLRVLLMETKPSIWRRFTVPADITLPELHVVLQIVMGWYDSHLHGFYLRPVGSRARSQRNWKELPGESRKTLESILRAPKVELIYEYDFGDSWLHQIKVEKRISDSSIGAAPTCIDGEGACPPEDCGGVGGYKQLLEAFRDESHPDHEDMLEWLEEGFDSEAFDREETNHRLAECWGAEA